MAEIEPFGRYGPRHPPHLLDAVADRGHRRAGDQHRKRLRDVLRSETERAGAVLIDHQLEVGRLLVPVELRLFRVGGLANDVARWRGDGANLVGGGTDDAELDREADGRTEIEAVDADAGLGQRALID